MLNDHSLPLVRDFAPERRGLLGTHLIRRLPPGFLLFLVGIVGAFAISSARPGLAQAPASPPATAKWYGVIRTETADLRTLFELSRQVDGTWIGTCISIDQKAARIPVSEIRWGQDQLVIELPSVDARFTGSLSADGRQATGVFTQRGIDLPLTLAQVSELSPPPTPNEVWRGKLPAGFVELTLQVRRLPATDGQPAYDLFDSLNEGISSLHAEAALTETELTIEVPALKAKFSGSLNEQRTFAKGWWRQGLIPLPMTFECVTEALTPDAFQPRRPQTPREPFPYEAREVQIPAGDSVILSGTLTLPKGAGPFPGLILVSGSGPQDRDETIFDHRPFAVLADAITRAGIAVLRYDDRGVGKSQGNFAEATTEDFAQDAWQAWQWLAEQPEIDSARVGVGGHSEGALIASLLASQQTRPAFVLLLAPPGANGDRITRSQTIAIARAQGTSQAVAERTGQLVGDVNRAIRRCQRGREQELNESVQKLLSEFAADLESLGEPMTPEELDALRIGFTSLSSEWYRTFLTIEPAAALSQIQQPVLALLGQFDLQVPARENAAALRESLRSNPHATIEVQPGVNHLLQPSSSGVPTEYATIETTIDPPALKRIVGWLVEVAGGTGPASTP
jgi:hypothetical protein